MLNYRVSKYGVIRKSLPSVLFLVAWGGVASAWQASDMVGTWSGETSFITYAGKTTGSEKMQLEIFADPEAKEKLLVFTLIMGMVHQMGTARLENDKLECEMLTQGEGSKKMNVVLGAVDKDKRLLFRFETPNAPAQPDPNSQKSIEGTLLWMPHRNDKSPIAGNAVLSGEFSGKIPADAKTKRAARDLIFRFAADKDPIKGSLWIGAQSYELTRFLRSENNIYCEWKLSQEKVAKFLGTTDGKQIKGRLDGDQVRIDATLNKVEK